MTKTSIEWTHRPQTGGEKGGYSWNPIRARRKSNGKAGWACTHASPGCINCYAESINKRFGTGLAFNVPSLDQVELFISEKILQEPLRLKKPATIFVGDMFDLFHEAITDEQIEAVVAVAALCQQHTFQFLSKRADRLLRWFQENNGPMETCEQGVQRRSEFIGKIVWDGRGSQPHLYFRATAESVANRRAWPGWPLPNCWFGVSVESQKYADERIPLLLQTPAAVRFLSVEPMLEKITFDERLGPGNRPWLKKGCHYASDGFVMDVAHSCEEDCTSIDWVICGGESGPKARPFNLAWAENLLQQCKEAGVPFFMKQMGSNPYLYNEDAKMRSIRDRKGGDMNEWPECLRVREFPA